MFGVFPSIGTSRTRRAAESVLPRLLAGDRGAVTHYRRFYGGPGTRREEYPGEAALVVEVLPDQGGPFSYVLVNPGDTATVAIYVPDPSMGGPEPS
jgi:hypothetical protein